VHSKNARPRVLIVEDEQMAAWLLGDMLEELGFEVVGPAARVGDALAIVASEALDAAVLDVNLAGIRSYPVADALEARGVPFTFSTGYQKSSLPSEYQRFECLNKPYDLAKLGEKLRLLMPIAPG
jgi:CheY-like chemotaxis protein